ncbi:MAG: hypothetical protein RL217_368 [Pseudomonadota bacterium]|jgi:hypothetical protein
MKPLLMLLSALAAQVYAAEAPKGAEVYIISPKDGAVVKSPVMVEFGLKGMGIAPAGTDKANTGHHHLLINVKEEPKSGQPIPADAQHLHFGGGQTQTTLNLEKGTYSLQLNLGDMHHIPFEPPLVSPKITIEVQ